MIGSSPKDVDMFTSKSIISAANTFVNCPVAKTRLTPNSAQRSMVLYGAGRTRSLFRITRRSNPDYSFFMSPKRRTIHPCSCKKSVIHDPLNIALNFRIQNSECLNLIRAFPQSTMPKFASQKTAILRAGKSNTGFQKLFCHSD